jgi:hypothetical protein
MTHSQIDGSRRLQSNLWDHCYGRPSSIDDIPNPDPRIFNIYRSFITVMRAALLVENDGTATFENVHTGGFCCRLGLWLFGI